MKKQLLVSMSNLLSMEIGGVWVAMGGKVERGDRHCSVSDCTFLCERLCRDPWPGIVSGLRRGTVPDKQPGTLTATA